MFTRFLKPVIALIRTPRLATAVHCLLVTNFIDGCISTLYLDDLLVLVK